MRSNAAGRGKRYLLWHAEVDSVLRELEAHADREPQQAAAARGAAADLSAARAAHLARRPNGTAFLYTPPPAGAVAFAEAVRRTRRRPGGLN